MRACPRCFSSLLLVFAFLAGAAGACSSDDSPYDDKVGDDPTRKPQSGTRLKAGYLVGEDGTRVFQGWFDSGRNEYCRIARGESGGYRCFPSTNPAVFRDARCREPLGDHLDCAHKYTGVVRGDVRCENETLAIYAEGDPVTSDRHYEWYSELCQGPFDTNPSGAYVSTTGRVPDADFVGGTAESIRPDLRLGPRVVRFDDGAVAPFELTDARWDRRCVRFSTDSGSRCLPENAVYLGLSGPYFADSACSVPVAHANAPACLRPSVAIAVHAEMGCLRVQGVFALGERIDSRTVYSGEACTTNMPLPGHFYTLGAPIDLAEFPEIVEIEQGTARIRVRSYATSDGVPISHLGQRLYDSVLQVDCRVATAGDGVLRCLPLMGPFVADGDSENQWFADPECRQPLARHSPRGGCDGGAPLMAARGSQKRCASAPSMPQGAAELEPGHWDIFKLGRRYDGQVYVRSGHGCAVRMQPKDDEFYELEQNLEPRMFVAFRNE
jgi:hypothetical protein